MGKWWKVSDSKQRKMKDELSKKLKFLDHSRKVLSEINKRWWDGDYDLTIKSLVACRHLDFDRKNVGKKYLVCNEDYIDCFLESKKFQGVSVIKKQNLIGEDRNISIFSKAYHEKSGIGHFGILIKLTDGENTLESFFAKDCHQTRLDPRIYITKSKKNMTWDNINEISYELNKFLVTRREVNWWIETDHNAPKDKLETDSNNWFRPSTNLTSEQIKSFCAFRGERLLESHFYDAATIIPSDMNDSRNKYLKVYPYPWTKNFKKVFAYESRNTSNIDDLITRKNCNHIFSKECLEKFKYKFFDTNSVSWNGLYQILGGYPEVMRNTLDTSKPLKSSSFYLPIDSSDHELTKRVSLDKYSKEELPEVAFRCMREI